MNEDIIGENNPQYPDQTVNQNQIPEPIQVDLTKLNTNIDSNTLTTYLKRLTHQNLNSSLYLNLIKLLAEHHQLPVAYALTKLALEKFPTHPQLGNYQKTWSFLDQLPNLTEIQTKLKNQWLTTQVYKTDTQQNTTQTKLLYPQSERSDFNPLQAQVSLTETPPSVFDNINKNNDQPQSTEILDQITHNSTHIDSFPDTVLIIPPNEDYYLYRIFHVEPFQTYQLRCKCVTHLPVHLNVQTTNNHTRLNYKLSRSVIQYRFHSLNLTELRIGLKGNNPQKDKPGQLRLIELTLTKVPNLLYPGPQKIRNLTPKLPVIGTLNFPPHFRFTPEFEAQTSHWLQSILPQLDFLNIYLPSPTTKALPDAFQHPTLKVFTKQLNYPGTFHFIEHQPGYHFHFSPYFFYHDDYIPTLLTKIQQYNFKAVVGLHGIQLSEYPKKKIIPINSQINQDIKCHLLTFQTSAFFSQTILPLLPEIKALQPIEKSLIKYHISIGKLCQDHQVPLLSIERLTPLIEFKSDHPPHPEVVNCFDFHEEEDELIKSHKWRYF